MRSRRMKDPSRSTTVDRITIVVPTLQSDGYATLCSDSGSLEARASRDERGIRLFPPTGRDTGGLFDRSGPLAHGTSPFDPCGSPRSEEALRSGARDRA